MGGLWAMIGFQAKSSKEIFLSHVRVGSWFSSLKQASDSFHVDERITWIDIEGVPLKAWSTNTFTKIISKWGKVYWIRAKEVNGWNPDFMEEEDIQTESDNATIQNNSDVDEIPGTIFDKGQ
ncbi:hypothetical protein Tco_0707520 [Tanacetum coccineum]|uniref:DUF4283 domain-containing protein n=1 Tax=Tanacetum coccineum TaxID=301880 RepID=A0ABQ4YAH3_9ASTR